MNTKEIIEKLEEAEVDPNQISEIADHLKEKQIQNPALKTAGSVTITELQERMAAEPDWRKKAAMQARIISQKIDTEY